MEQVNFTLLREITHQITHHDQLKDLTLELMEQALLESGEERVFLGGALKVFDQPEFRDVEKLKILLASLEEDQIVKSLLKRQGREGTDISIGGENMHQGVKQCSIITTDYKLRGKTVGSIGVLGPTRMNYSKTVTLVEYVTEQLTYILEIMAKK